MEFSDIFVVPYDGLLEQGTSGEYHRGGPIWPDWETPHGGRHFGYGSPIDRKPLAPTTWRDLDAAQWCGPIHWHFGHMVAEFSMRLLPTALNGNPAPLLFCGNPPDRFVGHPDPLSLTPPFFRDMLDYAGLSPDRVLITGEPLRVKRLFVEPQAEHCYTSPPSAAHLDLLDAHAERRLGPVARQGGLFVSRAGMFARFAGEPYIERVLAAAGFRVIRPETLPLIDQLRAYRSHAHVIFSEGSALHAPQFLGRCFDRVDVLRREDGQDLNAVSVQPRCRELSYWSFMRGSISLLGANGKPWRLYALSVIDPDRFLEVMRSMGCPLDRYWDREAFAEAEARDAAAWAEEARRLQVWKLDAQAESIGRPQSSRLWDIPGNPARVAKGLKRFFGARLGAEARP